MFTNREKIIRVSRERYAKERGTIEEKISRWASGLEAAGIEEQRMISTQPPRTQRFDGPPPRRDFAPSPTPSFAPQFERPRPTPQPMQNMNQPRPISAPAQRPTLREVPPAMPATSTASAQRPPVASSPQPMPSARPVSPSASLPAQPLQSTPPMSAYQYDATCANCGIVTKVSFPPDGKRPVYCKECLRKVRSQKLAAPQAVRSSAPRPTPTSRVGIDVNPGQDIVLS